MSTLKQTITDCIIISHNEDVTLLSNTLNDEQISLFVSRPEYTARESTFPAHIRCLINHSNAWERASSNLGYTLVCEADFVPCKNFWNLPVPFKIQEQNTPIVAWLYSVGPVVYHYDQQGGFYGHNAGTVCYMLNSKAALLWLEIFNDHKEHKDFTQYYMWEVEMPIQLRRKGAKCYISSKCYGEHGGIPNKEHNSNGVRAWHQAESLITQLSFFPSYSHQSILLYIIYRIRARLRGIYRFFAGKYYDGWDNFLNLKPNRMEKLIFVVRRVFT